MDRPGQIKREVNSGRASVCSEPRSHIDIDLGPDITDFKDAGRETVFYRTGLFEADHFLLRRPPCNTAATAFLAGGFWWLLTCAADNVMRCRSRLSAGQRAVIAM
jgi:hypothetical protein